MFREMRRKQQLLSMDDTKSILKRCTNGVLACLGDEGYPYAVPLSYVHYNDKIYFHSAKVGHKMEALKQNPKVSFTIIAEDSIVSPEYTTYFRSVIIFGRARLVEGDEWKKSFEALVEKYSGEQPEAEKANEIAKCSQACIVAIDMEHITGKEAIEYVTAKNCENVK